MQIDTSLILAKSQFVQTVLDGNTAVAWHSLFGNPRTVSIETLEFLDEFREPKALCDVLDEETIDSQREAIRELLTASFLIPKEFDERTFLGEKIKERQGNTASGSLIDYLELIMSEACNFRCTYCIHFNNLETSDRINNPKNFMRFQVAREVFGKYLSNDLLATI